MCIHAMKASLKFTLSQRTKGPWGAEADWPLLSLLIFFSLSYYFKWRLIKAQGLSSWLWGWWVLRLLINNIVEDFIMFNSESNLDSWTHTNCFFLSVERRVISSLSAFISSSLYWKSRTMNLKNRNIGSAFLGFSWNIKNRQTLKHIVIHYNNLTAGYHSLSENIFTLILEIWDKTIQMHWGFILV